MISIFNNISNTLDSLGVQKTYSVYTPKQSKEEIETEFEEMKEYTYVGEIKTCMNPVKNKDRDKEYKEDRTKAYKCNVFNCNINIKLGDKIIIEDVDFYVKDINKYNGYIYLYLSN